MSRGNLILPGGGRNFVFYAGVLQGLLEAGFSPTGIAGTSAGGLIALLYALHARGRGNLKAEVMRAAPGSALKLDAKWYWWWPSHPFGRYTGKAIERHLLQVLKPTMGMARIPCAVVVANVTRRRQEIISSWGTGSEPTWRAGRATSAVPGLFEPVEWPGRGTVVDGGITSNLAVDDIKFPNNYPNYAIAVEDMDQDVPVTGLLSYLGAVVATTVDSNMREDIADVDGERVWRVKLPKGSSLDLAMSAKQAHAMFEQGRQAGRSLPIGQ